MTEREVSRTVAVVALLLGLGLGGCGGDRPAAATPADGVRAAVRAYLGTLQGREWRRACRLMTGAARHALADAAGTSCARALAAGAALPADELAAAAREVAGADVRIRGAAASIGPLGPAQQQLRLRRVGDRWLIAG